MSISDSTIMVGMLLVMNFFVIYKKNRFAGNMVYALIGGGIMYLASASADTMTYMFVGVIILLYGLVGLVTDLFWK